MFAQAPAVALLGHLRHPLYTVSTRCMTHRDRLGGRRCAARARLPTAELLGGGPPPPCTRTATGGRAGRDTVTTSPVAQPLWRCGMYSSAGRCVAGRGGHPWPPGVGRLRRGRAAPRPGRPRGPPSQPRSQRHPALAGSPGFRQSLGQAAFVLDSLEQRRMPRTAPQCGTARSPISSSCLDCHARSRRFEPCRGDALAQWPAASRASSRFCPPGSPTAARDTATRPKRHEPSGSTS